jgi:hypothetical protein
VRMRLGRRFDEMPSFAYLGAMHFSISEAFMGWDL